MKSIHDPRYLEIIARLRSARKSLKVSQVELSLRLGKPQSYISKVERGERRIDLVEALSLCSALGITLDTIIPTEMRNILTEK